MRDACPFDWQGPGDDGCVDDLLVVPCADDRGHLGDHHAPSVLVWDDRDRIDVRWAAGTGCLYSAYGIVVRHQFNPCPSDAA